MRSTYEFLCSCGEEFITTMKDFKYYNKRQCNKCSFENSRKKQALKYRDVKKYIEIESGSKCKLLSTEYINYNTKLALQCPCGNVFQTTLGTFKACKNKVCPDCSRIIIANKQRFSYDYVKNIIESTNGCKYLESDYKGTREQIKIRCSCGSIFTTTLNSFLNGKHQCDECTTIILYGRMKSRFENNVHNLVGDEYVFLGEYTNNQTKIKCKHNKCGHEWYVKPDAFLSGARCPQCFGKKVMTHDDFVHKVHALVDDEYVVLGEYVNNEKKVEMKHNSCGYTWETIPRTFMNGSRCPYCNGGMAYTHQIYCDKLFELVGDEYTPIEEYKTSQTPIKIRHNTCGYIWSVRPSCLFIGQRCPQCNESKGEQKVRTYLQNKNIKFSREYSFEELTGVGEGLLRFDFAVFKNNELLCLIEYDGELHYFAIDGLGGEQKFQEQKEHDKRKDEYCTQNNILLLRIPYWEFDNVEKILDKYLDNLYYQ